MAIAVVIAIVLLYIAMLVLAFMLSGVEDMGKRKTKGILGERENMSLRDRLESIEFVLGRAIREMLLCPSCGGPTEHDREIPPNPYICDSCDPQYVGYKRMWPDICRAGKERKGFTGTEDGE